MAVGAIGSAYGMDAMRKSVSGGEEHRMLPYDDVMLQPRSMQAPSSRTKTFDLPYPHFALMYIDRNGELGLEASPSLAGCGRAIFTEEVRDRFLKTAAAGGQPNSIPGFSFQQNSSWYQSGLSKSTELIPCEWQSQHQTKRQRRNGAMDRRGSDSMSPGPIKRTALRVGNQDLLRRYYEKAFENFQQLNCRVIAKAFIKLVEPRKQVNHPYNGRKTSAGAPQRIDPELTKPKWWPTGVTHKEPDHLLKAERIRLLVHILCELMNSHGITAEKLKEAGQDVRRQIVPSERLHVLDEIYYVRHMEECYLKGEIDGDTTIHVSHVHLAEANFEFDHHEQDASQSPQDQSVPTVTVKADGSSLTDDQTQKRNSDNDAVPSVSRKRKSASTSSDDRLSYVEDNGQLKQPTHQDSGLSLSPSSCQSSSSRKSSLEASLPSYSPEMMTSMMPSGAPARPICTPKDVHHTGSTCMPDYFTQQLLVPTPGQPTEPGYWTHPHLAQAQLVYNHGY